MQGHRDEQLLNELRRRYPSAANADVRQVALAEGDRQVQIHTARPGGVIGKRAAIGQGSDRDNQLR
ncbi:MAG: hypothetical protein KTR31_12930 [Myxococcales bacterium]|nr:hypothetical protein [Myxococcales bacterium]